MNRMWGEEEFEQFTLGLNFGPDTVAGQFKAKLHTNRNGRCAPMGDREKSDATEKGTENEIITSFFSSTKWKHSLM